MNIIVTEAKPGVRCISLKGRLDAPGVQAIEESFQAEVAAIPNLIVDMTWVPLISSIGVRLLVAAAQTQKKMGGKMVIVNPDNACRRVLKTTGIDQVVPVFERMEEATGAF
jgi:anti-anti-sigma factor